jgi:DNA-binding transcriptional LysR family regulator
VQYFVTVAEELHFGRAAARLHIAQPSLSHQIRVLEQQLGITLLNRTSRSVALTPAGEVLLRQGRRLLSQAQRAVELTRAAASERLTVGFAGTAASTLLPEVVRAFGEQQPGVQVSLRELPLDRVDDLLGGQVEVAFTRLLPGQVELEIEVLAREPRLVALPATHRLAARGSLTFADLRDESFITNPAVGDSDPPARWLREQQRHGLPGRVAAKAASIQEVLTLVATGQGICLVPASVARQYSPSGVRYVEVTDADPAVVSLAWHRDSLRPALEAFIETAHLTARAVSEPADPSTSPAGAKNSARADPGPHRAAR